MHFVKSSELTIFTNNYMYIDSAVNSRLKKTEVPFHCFDHQFRLIPILLAVNKGTEMICVL